ncbi:MAG: YCF48-related protein [Acidobacteriota bacterium]
MLWSKTDLTRCASLALLLALLAGAPGLAAITVAPHADFDGDGLGDIAVARKQSATTVDWGIRFSKTGLLDSWSGWYSFDYGNEGDKFYAGDFDGNGRTDMALCRRNSSSTYAWAVRYSTTGSMNNDAGFLVADFGNDGDFYFIGDFNGDGKDDVAICRPDGSYFDWGVEYSGSRFMQTWTGWSIQNWGMKGDRFYVGDFDGNGKADVALCRHENPYGLKWYIRYSTTGFLNYSALLLSDFGNAYDEFHVGDFDGNGKSDLALARQVTTTDMVWGVRYSNTRALDTWGGWTRRTEVGNEYFVMDFDGDDQSEIAVNNYETETRTRWGVYSSVSRFLDTWSGWVISDFGDQEDRFLPGGELGNTIEAIALRELGVNGANSPGWVDYYCHGNFSSGADTLWCSEFVSWCYYRAGNPFTGGTFDPGAPWLLNGNNIVKDWFAANAFWWDNRRDLPLVLKPGNYVRTQNSTGVKHSRMVQRVIGTTLYTVEGNSGNQVHKRIVTNFLSDTNVLGFGRLYDNDREDWKVQASSTNLYLRGVCFPSSTTGYAVGHDGIVIKTTDGGTNWNPVTVSVGGAAVTSDLYATQFTSTNTGYIVGEGGLILKTTNGGSSWTRQTSGTTASIYGIRFGFSAAIAVGQYGTILRTTNSGSTWTSVTSGTTQYLRDVDWGSSTKAVAVGDYGTILVSTNSGQNWVAKTSGTTAHLNGVKMDAGYMAPGYTGWVVGTSGTIRRTTNGGDTWSAQTTGTTSNLYDIDMVTSTTGHAVGAWGTILRTTNGGSSWTSQKSGESETFQCVDGTGSLSAWTVGSNGFVLRCVKGGGPLSSARAGRRR